MQGTSSEGIAAAQSRFADPVCGMQVSESSPHRHRIEDIEYRFCSAQCRERFQRDPRAFLQEDALR